MTDMPLDLLNRTFSIPHQISFVPSPGAHLALARIDNVHASALIALQGAQLLSHRPKGEAPLVWLSEAANYIPGKSVRGGIPVCWPWFGPHPDDPSKATHGFARNVSWNVVETRALEDGATFIALKLTDSPRTQEIWPHAFELRLEATIGRELALELVTHNNGTETFHIGEALHTYFHVGGIDNVRVLGLEGRAYIDKVDGGARKTQAGPVVCEGEVDRIFLDVGPECLIEDTALQRRIRLVQSGSRATVVWNPWREKAERLGDMGEEGYRSMICVETANAADFIVTVPPDGEHRIKAVMAAEKLS
jgi:glucose-6-phosphate 1-epimerase